MKYYGGQKVARGVYLDLAKWDFIQLYEEAPVLPGDKAVSYLKVPAALTMIAGPLTGLVFVIFLPFVGILGLLGFLGYRAWRGMSFLVRRAVQPAVVGWKPGVAYLTRRGTRPETRKPEGKAGAELAELEREVARRREAEKKER